MPKGKPISLEIQEAMVAMYLTGSSASDIASQYGYHSGTIRDLLKRRRIDTRHFPQVNRRIPSETEDAIIAAYLEGASSSEVGRRFGYSGRSCLNVLQRRGIQIRTYEEALDWSSSEKQEEMIAAYLNGASSTEVAEKYGYDASTCLRILKRKGIKVRTNSEAQRRYAVDEHFFDVIDTEEKAYWLGFLAADGCISSTNPALHLNLQAKDEAHLNKFKTALCSEHPIKYGFSKKGDKIYPQVMLTIVSKALIASLADKEINPQKSLTLKPYSNLPDHLRKHYWRGMVDGDGCILYVKTCKAWRVHLVGSQEMVLAFAKFVAEIAATKARMRPKGKVFEISYLGNVLARSIIEELYSNATTYLERKMKLARLVMEGKAPGEELDES